MPSRLHKKNIDINSAIKAPVFVGTRNNPGVCSRLCERQRSNPEFAVHNPGLPQGSAFRKDNTPFAVSLRAKRSNPVFRTSKFKIFSYAISLILGLGLFVNSASANLVDTTTITPNLINGLNLSGIIAVNALPQIPDIPLEVGTDNTTGIHPDQAAIIVSNILKDPAVRYNQQNVITKQAACAASLLAIAIGCDGTKGTTSSVASDSASEVNALRVAVVALGDALLSARSAQDGNILAYETQNSTADIGNSVGSALNQSSNTAATNLGTQSNIDAANAVVGTDTTTINQADVSAQKAAVAAGLKASQDNPIKFKDNCISWSGGVSLTSCIADLVYAFVYIPASYALEGAGYVFDKMLMLSVDNSQGLVAPSFIDDTWKAARDISNMLFIFVLIYAGIMTMFGMGDWAKTVRNVVIIALLINFSLFFSKVIIDAGNILALGVKSAIMGNDSISAGLAGAFSPQTFLSTASKSIGADPTGGTLIVVFLIAAIVSGYTAYVFFKMGLLFLGRLIGFWALMILSPFAFISFTLPKGNVFMAWLNELLGLSFVAPVFLFLIYIIMRVVNGVNGGLLSQFTAPDSDWFSSLLGPVIVAMLLIEALRRSLAFSSKMAGDFGSAGAEMAGKAMGIAGGVALGGTALAGRAVLGRAAQGLADSGKLAKLATSDNAVGRFMGRQAITLNDKARTGTWDARGTKIVQTVAKDAGIKDLGAPGASAKGGFEGAQKRQDEADKTFVKKLKVTDEEKAAIIGPEKSAKEAADSNQKKAEDAVKAAQEAYNKSPTAVAIKNANEEVTRFTNEANGAQEAIAKAQKAFDEGFADNGSTEDAALKAALEAAKTAGKPQLDALKDAQNKLSQAKDTDKNSPVAQALKENIATAEKSVETAKEAVETAKKALDEKQKLVDEENARRRGSYADYVENRGQIIGGLASTVAGVAGGAVGGVVAGPLGVTAGYTAGVTLGVGTYSTKQAKASAKKIRGTSVNDEEKEAEENKTAEKLLKKLAEEQAKKDAAKPAAPAAK